MIFCSSQFPFYCSPTCPLLVVAMLLCSSSWDRAWSSYPFLPSCWRADSARAPTSDLVGSSLGLGQSVVRPWAGEGTGSSFLSWLSLRLQPLPI